MPIKTFQMTLKWADMIAPQVRHLAFERTDGVPFDFVPGQFVTIHFENEGKTIKRSYSLASNPAKSALIEFAVGHFPGGPGTKLLFNLKPGEELTTSGPFGRLILRDEVVKRYIFLATSTGVTPFRTMLPELEKRMQQNGTEVVLLLGVQRRDDLLYGAEFIDLAQQEPGFTFRAHYSQEPNINEQHEYKGYVQQALPELNLDPENDVVYLCGNPNMIDAAFNSLKDGGFDSKSVRREKYISAK